MSYEEDIQRDIEELDGMSKKNMVLREKIISKLETAIDSIDFASAKGMKASQLLAVTGLVSTLNSTLNDTEDSKMKVLKSKQKTDKDNSESENASQLIAKFLNGISSGDLSKLPPNAVYHDETLLDKEIQDRKIEANEDELSYGQESEHKISEIVEEMS